ncbi:UPF0488 protein C8orf33 homolog [Rhinophrynus dorsalis]
MEEAPKGTFEDELEWCINQLETGLLRLNPTPAQVSDTQRVLQILRSRKASFVKKRQVMNKVFGDYRTKMADERKEQERAASNPTEAQIHEGAARDSKSVAYRKCSKDTPGGSGHWFTTSDNSFSFSFCPDETDQIKEGGSSDAGKAKCEGLTAGDTQNVGQSILFNAGTGSGFTFGFQIPEADASPSELSTFTSEASGPETSSEQHFGQTSPEVKCIMKEQKGSSQSQRDLKAAVTNPESGAVAIRTVRTEVAGTNSGDSPKKKKKKGSQGKKLAGTAQTENKAVEKAVTTSKMASSQEEPQTGADELRRELDWCVEQLEIGLQRQKSTPKQVEEALRAIKTLRSEKAALVKKRQVMRAMFGDYRKKMEEEKQKQLRLMQTAAKSARVSEVAAVTRRNSSKVFRQSLQNSSRNLGQCHISPVSTQTHPTDSPTPCTSQQDMFVFKSSEEPFCFNFF